METNRLVDIDFHALGIAAYRNARDAFATSDGEDEVPGCEVGYDFMLWNAECFTENEQPWPDGMPTSPPMAFVAGWEQERTRPTAQPTAPALSQLEPTGR